MTVLVFEISASYLNFKRPLKNLYSCLMYSKKSFSVFRYFVYFSLFAKYNFFNTFILPFVYITVKQLFIDCPNFCNELSCKFVVHKRVLHNINKPYLSLRQLTASPRVPDILSYLCWRRVFSGESTSRAGKGGGRSQFASSAETSFPRQTHLLCPTANYLHSFAATTCFLQWRHL